MYKEEMVKLIAFLNQHTVPNICGRLHVVAILLLGKVTLAYKYTEKVAG
jgi:hypothetical protein